MAAKHSKTEQSDQANRVEDTGMSASEQAEDIGFASGDEFSAGGEVDEVMTPEVEVVGDGNPSTGNEGASTSKEDEHRAELDAIQQQMLRVQADFDNFRRRTRQEKEELQQFATRKLLADLLPVADNFDRALAALSDDDAKDMKTGVEMVQRQFLSVLEQYGVKAMEVVNQPFNPNVHEAVLQEPAEGREPGIIVQELQKGYELHGKVLRPAMVKVTV